VTRPRVLVIAEAANPEWVSVPLVGWSLAQALREVADVHLVTQVRNRDAILRAGLVEGRDFTAIDSESFARPMWKIGTWLTGGKGKGWTTLQALEALTYPHFERLVWRQFGGAIRSRQFDVVHRVTPLSPTVSGPLAARVAAAGVPYVIGPLNGGVPWPAGFDGERRQEREWLSYVRGAYKALPGRGRMLAATRVIIAGSRHTASEIPAVHQGKVVWLPENAIDPTRFARESDPPDGILSACFIGRLVPYKGCDMALAAAAPLLQAGRMRFDIVGDGPMMADLQGQVTALGVTDAVTFHGWLPHAQVQDVACRSQILLFPSIREFGGGVVLEAMALGLAPVIVDYAGPGELVTPGLGWKVPIGDRAAIVGALTALLAELADNPAEVSLRGAAARARVRAHFTWAAKARQVAQVYAYVTGRRTDLPVFFTDEQPIISTGFDAEGDGLDVAV
jgi:glycosyltransferase involved in cell wall biosynthesis